MCYVAARTRSAPGDPAALQSEHNSAENRRAAAAVGTPGGAGRDKNDGDAPSQGPKGK